MKKVLMMLCMAGVMACLTSCGKTAEAASVDALNGEWTIVEVSGQDITKNSVDEKPFIGLDVKEKRMYGSTSCNRLFGSIVADAAKGTLSFGEHVGSTRMMCANMETERLVIEAVNKVGGYELRKDGSLVLKSKDGEQLLVLKKK